VGAELQVEPVALLRHQQTFSGLDALQAQIGADAQRAQAVLNAAPRPG